jgi:glycosyltransferase involved in cell wall biosynthesis
VNLPVTAIVTAYKRVEQTLATLRILMACEPCPAEILVHVDGNQKATLERLKSEYPEVRYLLSEGNVGPGGGRNKLLQAASHELVASFDDDSYPMQPDYFDRAVSLFEHIPEASVITCKVVLPGEESGGPQPLIEWSSDFCGGACVYRKKVFLETSGYVPLPTAYGMEEVDLALRLHAAGHRILKTSWMQVMHDTDLGRHAEAEVTAGSIANIALLAFLRYPVVLWPVGFYQMARRVSWLFTHGRSKGVLRGLGRIPAVLWKNRHHRLTLSLARVKSFLKLRRWPLSCAWPEGLSGKGSVHAAEAE